MKAQEKAKRRLQILEEELASAIIAWNHFGNKIQRIQNEIVSINERFGCFITLDSLMEKYPERFNKKIN